MPDTGRTLAVPRTVFSSSLNGIEPGTCIRNGAYPAQRYMWLNTILGYRTGGISGDERGLAECFSGSSLTGGVTIQQIVRDQFGLMEIPIGCKSFDESRCGDGGPTNSCANNPLAVAALLALGEPCTSGYAVREQRVHGGQVPLLRESALVTTQTVRGLTPDRYNRFTRTRRHQATKLRLARKWLRRSAETP